MMMGKKQENIKRQKTLLASMLLSLWAPLATGIAAFYGRSITQFADFIRRTMEFLILLLSWLVFRYLNLKADLNDEKKIHLEKFVNYGVGIVLGLSGIILFILALLRLRSVQTIGNIWPGLVITVLGFFVNLWFWRRYKLFLAYEYNAIIDAQRQLYLAKVFVDACILLSLISLLLLPEDSSFIGIIDIFGSISVALYLLWSSYKAYDEQKEEA